MAGVCLLAPPMQRIGGSRSCTCEETGSCRGHVTQRDTPGQGWTLSLAPGQVPARAASGRVGRHGWDFPGSRRGAQKALQRCASCPATGFLGPFDGKELRPRKGVTLDATLPSTKCRVPVALPTLSHSRGSRESGYPCICPHLPTRPSPADNSMPHACCQGAEARGWRVQWGVGGRACGCRAFSHTGGAACPRPGL